jgi:hypothetical protein
MARNGEQLDDRSAVLPAERPGDPRSIWTPRRSVRRALIAAYLLTLAALATVGWIDALNGGVRESDPTRTLWVALFILTLVQVALLTRLPMGNSPCAYKTWTNANAPRGTSAIATAIGSWPALSPFLWPWPSSCQWTGSWAPPTG